jgi:CRP-like cAMP-binding protein
MHKLFESINIYIALNDSELLLHQNAVEKRTYKKNDMIFTEGKISNEIYFIEKGCVRLFYNIEGNDKTAFFLYRRSVYLCR